MLNWQRPYDNNKGLNLTSNRLHTTAEPGTWAPFVHRQSCVLRLHSLKGKAGVLSRAHDVQTDQECRALQSTAERQFCAVEPTGLHPHP